MTTLIRNVAMSNIESSERQLYGIEVEVENYRTPCSPVTSATWSITDDGSLRDAGAEFLTPGAWDLDTCIENIGLLWRDINNNGYASSIRTGVHVHVNCLDYTNEQLGGILATYCLLEPVLFRLCGPEREEGIYCVPWYRADNEVTLASQMVCHEDFMRTNQACKYSALYLAPLIRFGTIEFRHAPTFETASDMVLWLTVIDRLVGYGKQHTAAEVITQFESTDTDVWVNSIFGSLTRTIAAKCEKGFEDIIEEVDCMSVAEELLPSDHIPSAWSVPTLYVQGEGTRGYHSAPRARRAGPFPELEPFVDYDAEPEDFIEEDF